MSDAMPNFDSMSPEEIMAWMESLAKRQGANEGFTTSADVDIPEVDPTSVVIDEPGYVPSEGKQKGQKITSAVPPPAASKPAPAPAQPSFSATPKFTPPAPKVEPAAPPSFAALKFEPPAPSRFTPLSSFAVPKVDPPAPPKAEPTPEPLPIDRNEPSLNSLSWLESLAADQNAQMPSFDLFGFEAAPPAPAVEDAFNPVDWLAGLSPAAPDLPLDDEAPIGDGDTINWLETLARRQGADAAELVTAADMDIPVQESFDSAPAQYTGFSFDSPTLSTRPEVKQEPPVVSLHEDAGAWLDSLTNSEATIEADTSADDVINALQRGEAIDAGKMEAWMNQQLHIGAARPDPDEFVEPEEPQAIPAEIPDWLLEQTGGMPLPEPTITPKISLDELVSSASSASAAATAHSDEDIPDWLRGEEEQDTRDLDAIFTVPALKVEEPAPLPPAPVIPVTPPSTSYTVKIDMSDPWAEAFEHEYTARQGETRPVNAVMDVPAVALPTSNLPIETDLVPGEAQTVPAWADTSGMAAVVEAPAPAQAAPALVADEADISNWLATLDAEASDVPSWLTETLTTAEQPISPAQASAPIFTINEPTPPPAYKPAPPVRPVTTNINAAAVLSQARASASSNDIDSALSHYETLVRANSVIDDVSADLAHLADKVKTSPAILRVWGDALMRQGKLQTALDTYRKALNQL